MENTNNSNEQKKKGKVISGLMYIVLTIIIGVLLFTNISVNKEKEDIQTKYNNLSAKYSDLEKDSKQKIEEAKKESEELKKEETQNEINKNIKELESKRDELSKQKKDLETEISTLKAEVVRVKGEAKTYPAGHLTVGTDVPAGKYKIFGGSSNFSVHSASGRLEVNIILGTGSYKVEEYIYTFKTGDKIEANSSFKLVEVE